MTCERKYKCENKVDIQMYFQNECTLFTFIFHKGLLPVEFFLFYYMCNLHDTYVYVCTSYIWGRTFDFQLFFLSCLTFVSDCVRGCLFCVCMSFLSCAKTSRHVACDTHYLWPTTRVIKSRATRDIYTSMGHMYYMYICCGVTYIFCMIVNNTRLTHVLCTKIKKKMNSKLSLFFQKQLDCLLNIHVPSIFIFFKLLIFFQNQKAHLYTRYTKFYSLWIFFNFIQHSLYRYQFFWKRYRFIGIQFLDDILKSCIVQQQLGQTQF